MTVRLRAWLAILAVAVGVYFIGRWQGAASVADAAAVRDAETALAAGNAYRQRIATLSAIQQQHTKQAQSWHRTADSLRTLAVHADTITVADSGPVSLWRATANAERASAMQCVLALASCGERAQAAELRAAALDSILGNVLKVKDCKIMFVPCPSRWLALAIGGIGGALVGSQLKD